LCAQKGGSMAEACSCRGSHPTDEKCQAVNGADSTHSVDEVIEMARALSEGDFDRRFSQKFQGELGALAGYIENLRQRMKGISSAADSSSYLIPQASMGVAGISQQTEMGINSILELVEGVLGDQERVLHMVEAAGKNGKGADLSVFQAIAEKSKRSLMAVMSALSFQDVIRQRAEGVQETLGAVEKKIVELLIKFKVEMSGDALQEVDARDRVREEVKNLTDDIGLDQALVDELLENIK
jgi:hypothetical protein